MRFPKSGTAKISSILQNNYLVQRMTEQMKSFFIIFLIILNMDIYVNGKTINPDTDMIEHFLDNHRGAERMRWRLASLYSRIFGRE